ncbi:MAG: glycerophosphodiester phosphodiesterase [Candidatus Thorarchaeota archaeon]|jgi:glycerophosphoryl diester phosphodiesterase
MSDSIVFGPGRPLIMGHRGDPSKAPENTMRALKAALEVGVDFLESDIRLTRDNELVLFHDEDLRRTTGVSGSVRERSLEELRQIDFGRMFTQDGETYPFRDKGLSVVSLREAFAELPHARFNLDIKDSDRRAPHVLAEVLEEYDRLSTVTIASFIPEQMKLFREIAPDAITSAHPKEVRSFILGTRFRALSLFSRNIQYQAFQVPIKYGSTSVINERFVEQAHKRRIAVHVWTINDRDEMEWLIDLGVDGIFTDEPALMREVLSDLGLI